MTTLREAAQQALEALEGWKDDAPSQWSTNDEKRITTLRAALEQPEQEPVAFAVHGSFDWHPRESERVLKLTRKAQHEYDFTMPLYTYPPRREWQSLSLEAVAKALADAGLQPEDYREDGQILPLVRAIEQALKEKNHG